MFCTSQEAQIRYIDRRLNKFKKISDEVFDGFFDDFFQTFHRNFTRKPENGENVSKFSQLIYAEHNFVKCFNICKSKPFISTIVCAMQFHTINS